MRTVFILSAFILISLTDSAWSQTPEPIGFGISIVRETDPKIGMAHVVSVDPGSDAEKAGVKPGDIITSVDTPPIEDGHPKTTVHLHHADAPKPIIVALQDKSINLPIPQKVEMVTFGGIGMAMHDENGAVKVLSVVENDPAAKAGVKPGDIILAVDGKSIAENALTADSLPGLVRGKVGTIVQLTIQHDGDAKPVTLAITRVAITVPKPNPPKPQAAAPSAVVTLNAGAPAPINLTLGSVAVPPDKTMPGVSAINGFSFALLDKVLASAPNDNAVLSPLSADLALSMVMNGAAGDTRTAMLKGLQYPGSVEDLNKANQNLVATLRMPDPGVEISMANGLWTLGTLKPSFVTLDQDVYGAELGNLADGPDNINAWVEKQTKGKITDLISRGDIDSNTRAVLVNAFYFKGHWVTRFDKSLTKDAKFSLPDGSSKTCQMMRHADEGAEPYYYYKDDGLEMVRLGYGNGREIAYDQKLHQAFSMVLILPSKPGFFSKPVPIADVTKRLEKQDWQSWLGKMKMTVGTVSMPRLHSELRFNLNEPLSALGMGIAFDQNAADFSAMSDEALHISQVVQKTYLDVDEEGTTAAAATQAGMANRGGDALLPPHAYFNMVLNRPFLAAIVDNRSGAIVFLAAIDDPG